MIEQQLAPSVAGNSGSDIVYLGISGVLHPSESLYQLVHGRSPWVEGHSPFESVPLLEDVLNEWPSARIILTSTHPWRYGLPATLSRLGRQLATRVLGFTYQDLTTKPVRTVRAPAQATARLASFSDADYWRMDKSDIVLAHVEWLRPRRWVAIDDEDILWPDWVREHHLLITDGCEGLHAPDAVRRLVDTLRVAFAG